MAFVKNFLVGIKIFFKSLGLLEQAQIVASTAVVIAMITIITVRSPRVKPSALSISSAS